MAFAEQARSARQEQSKRRDAALERQQSQERQEDRLVAIKTGMVVAVVLTTVALMGGGAIDSPGDHFGPDERAHVAAGRLTLR